MKRAQGNRSGWERNGAGVAGRRAERGAGRTSPELAMSKEGRAAGEGAAAPGSPA